MHPDTLQVVANLGVNYKDAGRVAEAIPLLEEAYRAATTVAEKAYGLAAGREDQTAMLRACRTGALGVFLSGASAALLVA